MEWTKCLKNTIDYMEQHLLEEIDLTQLAKEVAVSPFYLQKGFSLLTGITISEYIRNRRLYLAALDLTLNQDKVIDVALRYGYDTPESFSRAFARFHGVSPANIKGAPSHIKSFLPLRIQISITGGTSMEYSLEKMNAFQVIGFKRSFSFDDSYDKIPKFWDEFHDTYMQGNGPAIHQEIITKCQIGEYGLCISLPDNTSEFDYLIAGTYHGEEIPKDMVVVDIPELEWMKFRCVGPLPSVFQALNTRIFKEWLPDNPEFELAADMNFEWYSAGNPSSKDYESGIWIPVKRKKE